MGQARKNFSKLFNRELSSSFPPDQVMNSVELPLRRSFSSEVRGIGVPNGTISLLPFHLERLIVPFSGEIKVAA